MSKPGDANLSLNKIGVRFQELKDIFEVKATDKDRQVLASIPFNNKVRRWAYLSMVEDRTNTV